MLHRVILFTILSLAIGSPVFAQQRQRERTRGPDNAPAEGSAAPDFELELLGSDEVVRLSEACKDGPVVLIFGSYT